MAEIRIAAPGDLPTIVEIYNQAIAAGNATADTAPLTVESRRGWFAEHAPEQYPIYVYEEAGRVIGWLSISVYRPRPALARTGEVSYYVDYTCHGRGIGSALMQYALQDAARIGKKVYLAILLEGNVASRRLLEKYGFERWGYLPGVADLPGGVCGQYYYGREIYP
jgi:L-amino acid N-acyltransferase YncA